VLDLGSGSGKVCFIAAQIVGPAGRVIGIDINSETVDAQPETFLVRVLNMQAPAGGKLNDFIEQRDEHQFAYG
jgi:arsenite methyltransferase